MKVQIQRRFLSFSFRFCCYFWFLHFESLCFLILCLLLFCCLVCSNVYACRFVFVTILLFILFESCHCQFSVRSKVSAFSFCVKKIVVSFLLSHVDRKFYIIVRMSMQ